MPVQRRSAILLTGQVFLPMQPWPAALSPAFKWGAGGGHEARPHEMVDAVLVAAQSSGAPDACGAQARPGEGRGRLGEEHAGGQAATVIAEAAMLRGTIRSFNPAARDLLHQRVREIAEGVGAALGAAVEVETRVGVHATVCVPEPTALVSEAAAAVLGGQNIDTSSRTTGGEDFSAVADRGAGQFLLPRRGDARGINAPHPNPRFDIDEACLCRRVSPSCSTRRCRPPYGGGRWRGSAGDDERRRETAAPFAWPAITSRPAAAHRAALPPATSRRAPPPPARSRRRTAPRSA